MSDNNSILPSASMKDLLGKPEVPKTQLEKVLDTVSTDDAGATSMEQVQFQFRSLLDAQQLADLKENAPVTANKMIKDYNEIIQFGAPVLEKLNETTVHMLEIQQGVKIPAADVIVNDLLRSMDGYQAKFRNQKAEDFLDKIKGFFQGVGYSFSTMVRESKPIKDKLDLAAEGLREMELKLADNITRSQKLRDQTFQTNVQVSLVLAALEEIIDVVKEECRELDVLLEEADKKAEATGLASVEYKGQTITLQELRNIHTSYANGLTEIEKTWFDWRQQFFLGYTTAPALTNLISTTITMQRRCQTFRTMGIPSARTQLVVWQQAVIAKEGADVGNAVQEGNNKLIRGASEATANAVVETAKASQAPIISEETVFTIIENLKAQCDGLVAADRWGREQRARNLRAMETGERGIREADKAARRQLIANALSEVRQPQGEAPLPERDVLKQIGAIN